MVRLASRLISLTTTVCLSAGIHNLLHTKSAPSHALDQAQSELTAVPISVKQINESSTESTSRISQEGIVRFSGIGDVRVCAHEDFGTGLRLTFIDQKSGREILSTYFGNSNWNWSKDPTNAEWNPKLRFKAISVKGFPNPLVIGHRHESGSFGQRMGSSCGWRC